MQAKGFGVTDVGRQREHNEDNLLVDDELGLYIVCDGIGGQAAGEVASNTATQTIHDVVLSRRAEYEQGATAQARLDALCLLLAQAIQAACAAVYDLALTKREYYGMGTTVTAVVMLGHQAVMGHVGDCRLYLQRGLGRYLGDEERLLLQHLSRREAPEAIVQDLVSYANERGGVDNITVLLVRPKLQGEEAVSKTQELKLRLGALQAIPLFRDFPLEHLARLLYVVTEASYLEGEVIIHEDDACSGMAILLEGRVLVEREGTRLAELPAMTHFGEISCIYRRPATATITADAPCRCLWLGRDDVDKLIQHNPRLGLLLLRNLGEQLCQRLDHANHQLVGAIPKTLIEIDPSALF
jgi:serine/threonine protein phosphatase PrpC